MIKKANGKGIYDEYKLLLWLKAVNFFLNNNNYCHPDIILLIGNFSLK